MANLTRAVIDLSRDIARLMPRLMPRLEDAIKGAVHNRISDTMAFRFEDHAVIIEHGQMIIMHPTDIAEARRLYHRFEELVILIETV